MTEPKYLAFEISNEYAARIAILAWDLHTENAVMERLFNAAKMHDEDKSLTGLCYHHWFDVYERSDDIINWIGDDAFDDERWVIVNKEPDKKRWQPVRTDFTDMKISVFGNFCLDTLPKHSTESLESTSIALGTEGVFARAGRFNG